MGNVFPKPQPVPVPIPIPVRRVIRLFKIPYLNYRVSPFLKDRTLFTLDEIPEDLLVTF